MKDGKPVVLVTGANGFIGRHLSPVLESNGWTVRRAVRTSTEDPNEILVETIGPQTYWRNALKDVDAIVHLAARVHHPNEENAIELYRSVNIQGTLNLARSAADQGVTRFVFISSILVNGRATDGRAPFRETDLPTPRGVYGRSKAAAEEGLESLAGNMRVSVVRPPIVYGAGAKGNFKLLAGAVLRGVPLPFASIRNRRAFMSVENLVSFIQQRLLQADSRFDVFLVADQEQVSTPEFITRLAKAAGTSSRLIPVPTSILRLLLKISGRPEIHESLIGSLELDVSKVASSGWRPQITLDEGLRRAMMPGG
jgi:UDP-glucose 4-epimerase